MPSSSTTIETTVLGGAVDLLELHVRELPQRDDLCGAFCASLAMRVALAPADAAADGFDQDAVAVAAGTVVSAEPDPSILPAGERGRRDYRLQIPVIEDAAASGTTTAGLVAAIDRLSAGRLVAVPYAEPWTPATLAGLFDLAAACQRPAALVANLATHHLWGSHPRPERLLAYLFDGGLDGPPPDWNVGHFVCLLARARGPGGSLYMVADTYPSLGVGGLHWQPEQRLAAAIDRSDRSRETPASGGNPRFGQPAGGVLAILAAEDVPAVRAGAARLGLVERLWNNGTAAAPAATSRAGEPSAAPHTEPSS